MIPQRPSTSMHDVLSPLLEEPGSDSSGLLVGLSIACANFELHGGRLDRIGKQLSPSRQPRRFESSETRRTT